MLGGQALVKMNSGNFAKLQVFVYTYIKKQKNRIKIQFILD